MILAIYTLFVFVVATLTYDFSSWSPWKQWRRPLIWSAAIVVALCAGFVVYGLFFAESIFYRSRYMAEDILSLLVTPLFLLLPFAAVHCISTVLRSLAIGENRLRIAFILSSITIALVAPIAYIIAACGLAGICI